MHKFLLYGFLIFFSFIIPVRGAKEPSKETGATKDTVRMYNLSEVVITANKFAAPMLEIASSVTILNEAVIRNSNKSYVSEVLRDVPGLSIVQQGGPGKVTRVFMRGANPHHTLVLLDGVEMNDPGSLSNAFDISNLQTENIERIEVLRGPQSNLYGSDAMAGVVSIFTKKGQDRPSLALSAEGGSYDTYKGAATFSGQYSVLDYYISYSGISSGGFSAAGERYGNTEKDSYLNNSILSRLGVNVSKNVNVDLFYKINKSRTDLDQNSKLGDDPNFRYNLEESSFRAAANVSLFNDKWGQVFSFSWMRNINSTRDEADEQHPAIASHNYYTGKRLRYDWQNNLKLIENNTLSFGVETEEEIGYSSFSGTSEWGPFTSEFPSAEAYTTGIYIQDQISLFNSLFANAGLRYDRHNLFGSIITYRIAPAYFIRPTATKLKATYGTGFKSPSLYYLYDPAYGNKDLKPEKSSGWDIGIEQYLFKYLVTAGVTYFDNKFDNLIGYDNNFKTVNIDKAQTKGVEVFVTASPFKNLSADINYTYCSTMDLSEGKEDSGRRLLRRPENKFSFNVSYSGERTGGTLELLSTGKREDKDFSSWPAVRVNLGAYTLVNISSYYNITDNIKIFGRIDNIFDEEYEEVLFYGTPGISGTVGLKLNLR